MAQTPAPLDESTRLLYEAYLRETMYCGDTKSVREMAAFAAGMTEAAFIEAVERSGVTITPCDK